MLELIISAIGEEVAADVLVFVFDLIAKFKDWATETTPEQMQEIKDTLVGTINEYMYTQQRIVELLEMILLSLVVFITFYVLRLCLSRGNWK